MTDGRTGGLTRSVAAARPGLAGLLRHRPLVRLIGVRLASSAGDGAFQGALVSAVLFNPTRESSAAAIAGAFAALLLPYSLIGPFVGALLDRWDRRRVIIVATFARIGLLFAVAALLAGGAPSWLLLTSALLVTGAARFVGSGVSAALPHTIEGRRLVDANALAVTLASIGSAAGAGYALGMRSLIGETDGPVAVTTASVAVFYLLAILIVRAFARGALGPDSTDEPATALRAVADGLASAARHTVERATVGLAIAVVVLVRFCFGIATLVIVLLYQHYFTERVGLLMPGVAGLAEVLGAIAAGLLAGAIGTPILVRWVGRTRAMVAMMLFAGVVVIVCGLRFTLPATIIAAPLLAFTYQAVKVCVDAIIQSEAADSHVGRVFALYDTINNVFYVGAFALGALIVPADGRSVALLVIMASVYFVTALAYPLSLRRVKTQL